MNKSLQLRYTLGTIIFIASILILISFVVLYFKMLSNGENENIDGNSNQNKLIEGFYTYFIPYKNNESKVTAIVHDLTLENSRIMNPKNYYFPKVRLGISKGFDDSHEFVKVLSEILLDNSNMLNIEIVYCNTSADICKKLNSGELELGITASSILVNATMGRGNNFSEPLNNLRFITNIGYRYLFLVTTISTNIQTLDDLNGKRVGVGIPHSTTELMLNDIKAFLNEKSPINFESINVTHYKANEMLKNKELDAFFYCDMYPNTFMAQLVESDQFKNYLFLPIEIPDTDGFLTNYYYYKKADLDLNFLPKGYLPVNINGKFYFRFKPYLSTFKFTNVFLGNDKMPNKVAKIISETIFNRINFFNEFKIFKFDPIKKSDLVTNLLNVPIQEGTYNFLKEKGYITNNPNPNCLEKVGIGKCDLERGETYTEPV